MKEVEKMFRKVIKEEAIPKVRYKQDCLILLGGEGKCLKEFS